jgi:hypothetical protein
MATDVLNNSKTMDIVVKSLAALAISFVTYSVNEIRSDVKNLMAASNVSATKIENLENRINNLEKVLLYDKINKTSSRDEPKPIHKRLVFIKEENDYNIKRETAES